MSDPMDQIVPALRGHARWVDNYDANPEKYHQPKCSASTFDAAADEIERQRVLIAQLERELRASIAGEGQRSRSDQLTRLENERLRSTLQSIIDAKEPKDNPAPDDADWRWVALEMKRCAKCAVEQSMPAKDGE